MTETAALDRARETYRATRRVWFAGSVLDAYERLSVITVAAGARKFAFLSHLRLSERKEVSALLSTLSLQTRTLNARFDLVLSAVGVGDAAAHAYQLYRARHERFVGLGLWLNGTPQWPTREITLTKLGLLLGYPECCVNMDVQTKYRDHTLYLRALVREVGEDPSMVTHALQRRCAISKGSDYHLRKWGLRYNRTLARFPFALHAACDECLISSSSPTGKLSAAYEQLALNVSDELHFLVRWASHVAGGGRDQ